MAFEQCIPDIISEITSSELSPIYQSIQTLYYICVVEFTFAILSDSNQIFMKIHRIFDGVIDSDRLDYIVRDMRNAGVDWGTPSYERIIEAIKFIKLDTPIEEIALAFPQKISDDIDDIIVARYKIFSRINHHHRCMKTALLLQSAVSDLAVLYLIDKGKDAELFEGINRLWLALGVTVGSDHTSIRTIQWNDSWLMSTLYRSLVEIKSSRESLPIKKDDAIRIERMLEEAIMNRKSFYSLLKRKSDATTLAKMTLEAAGVSKKIDDLYSRAFDMMISAENDDIENAAIESLGRLDLLKIFSENGDFELLDSIVPMGVDKTIINVLENMKKDQAIIDFVFMKNTGKNKTGMNGIEDLYLYDKNNQALCFGDTTEIQKQIKALRANCLGFFIYVCLDVTANKYQRTMDDLYRTIAKAIGSAVHAEFEKLFPSKINATACAK